MRILITGATGMIGSGVLLECLESPLVTSVVTLGRRATGRSHHKLTEIEHADLNDLRPLYAELSGFDGCFWCLGISSVGLTEEVYSNITYSYTQSAVSTLLQTSPGVRFVFVSGEGATQDPEGSVMWARVKGRAERAVLDAGLRDAVVFRPAFVQPLKGVTSRTRLYRYAYALARPVLPLLRLALPGYVSTTVEMGAAMIAFVARGLPADADRVLDSRGMRALAERLPRDMEDA